MSAVWAVQRIGQLWLVLGRVEEELDLGFKDGKRKIG
jgi:hypothetical protein